MFVHAYCMSVVPLQAGLSARYTVRLLCFGMCIVCDLMVAARFVTSLRNASVVIRLLQLNLISRVLNRSVIMYKVII